MTVENESELSVMKNEIKLDEKDVEMEEQTLRTDSEIAGLREHLILTKFCLDRFKHNEGHFKFYTGFETYEMFNIFYTFFAARSQCSYLLGFCDKY